MEIKKKIILMFVNLFFLIVFSSFIYAGDIGINFDIPTISHINIVNASQTDKWNTDEGLLNNVIDILGSWITNNLNWLNGTQINNSHFTFDTLNSSQYCIDDVCIGTWASVNTSGAGDFSFTDFHDSFVLNATILNTTENIQNLLNSTGIYSTYNASYFNRLNSINATSITNFTFSWNRLNSINSTFINNLTINFNRLNSINSSFLLENTTLFNRLNSVNASLLIVNSTTLSINTTANIQNLLNSTGIYSTFNATYEGNLDTNCSSGLCKELIYFANGTLFNQTIFAELVNSTALTINTTANIQNLVNNSINSSNYWDDYNVASDINFDNLTWTFGDNWNYISDINQWEFNETNLATTYYNASQSSTTAGTIDGGTLANTEHSDGIYDGKTFNFSEESGSPGLDLRINFTRIEDFTNGVTRYKTSSLAGLYPIIQLWNYDTSTWEDYPSVPESLSFATITQPVFDSSEHISDNVVQMRIYKASNGNTNNHYYVDWIAISKGYGTPAGEEVDPYSIHRDGNISLTGNWDAGAFNITAQFFHGLFDWIINATGISSSYLSFNGSDLTFDEAQLNTTILHIATPFNETGLIDSVNTSALSINTTANIQNLLNATGIYSTYNASYDSNLDTDTNCSNGLCKELVYFANSSLWNQTIFAELVNTTALTINTTANIQNLLNSSSMTFDNINSSGFCIDDVCIGTWASVNTSGAGDFSFTDFHDSFVLNATILNTTENIQNLLNSTGIYSTPLTINTTKNIQNLLNNTAMNFSDITLSQRITFAFGEIIDNIVDGWITITGNLFVTNEINATTMNATNFVLGDVQISDWASVNGSGGADTNCSSGLCKELVYFANLSLWNQTVLAELVNTTALTINTTANIQNLINDTNVQFRTLNMTKNNVTDVECIFFESGGDICAGS